MNIQNDFKNDSLIKWLKYSDTDEVKKMYEYYQLGIYNNIKKIIVIGDIHGDFEGFLYILIKSSLINSELKWIGKDTHVIQIGDILDRGGRILTHSDEDSEFKIITIISTLQYLSFKDGGGFHCIMGNHELMNIHNNFDFVTPMGMSHFIIDNHNINVDLDYNIKKKSYDDFELLKKNNNEFKKCFNYRKKYFEIGGPFTNFLINTWNPIVKINNWIFCHAGIDSSTVKYSINFINNLMRNYLKGNIKLFDTIEFKELFLNENSLLWNRKWILNNDNQKNNDDFYKSELLSNLLNNWNASFLVIGHTPSFNGIISKYNGKLWDVDVAISNAFGERKLNNKKRLQYLEILNNIPNIK